MNGSLTLRFSEMFADTVATHGSDWARQHYTRNGMTDTEFFLWVAICGVAA